MVGRVVMLLAVSACGCLSGGRGKPAVPADAAALVAAPRAAGTGFAELPRRPGGRAPLNPAAAPPEVPAAPVTQAPALARPPAVVPDPPVVAAVKDEVDGRAGGADPLAALPPANRDLVKRLVPVVVRAAGVDLARPGSPDVRDLTARLAETHAGLADAAPVAFDKALLVTRVDGFARYDPVPDRHRYQPGNVAEIYVELRNLRPAPAGPAAAEFETRIGWRVRLAPARTGAAAGVRGAAGPPVADLARDHAFPPTRSPVRDCHLKIPVHVPLEPGEYVLSVEIRDLNRPTGAAVSRLVKLEVGPRGTP